MLPPPSDCALTSGEVGGRIRAREEPVFAVGRGVDQEKTSENTKSTGPGGAGGGVGGKGTEEGGAAT